MELKRLVYLDNAATTSIDTAVLEKMLPYFGSDYGNPSSIYESGRKSASVIENSRKGIAEIIGSKPEEIIFTSGGTESDNLAILGFARANKQYGNHVLVSAIEHKAVLESAKQLDKEGFVIEYVPVDNYGVIDIDKCMSLVTEKTILISVMYANNEIGTIQPIQELSKRIKELRNKKQEGNSRSESPSATSYKLQDNSFPIFHTDACQTAGQLTINTQILGVDMMTLNAGKIYGPKGVGILYKRENINIEPIIFGGGQENGLRSGTENVPLIVGMYEALIMVEKNRESESIRLINLRDYLFKSLKEIIPDVVLNGHPTDRLPNNVHISIPDIEGESIVLMLDEKGVQVSTGSACSSHDLEVSHVLRAIKQHQNLMHGSIRISLGKDTTEENLYYFVTELSAIVQRLKSMSSLTIQI